VAIKNRKIPTCANPSPLAPQVQMKLLKSCRIRYHAVLSFTLMFQIFLYEILEGVSCFRMIPTDFKISSGKHCFGAFKYRKKLQYPEFSLVPTIRRPPVRLIIYKLEIFLNIWKGKTFYFRIVSRNLSNSSRKVLSVGFKYQEFFNVPRFFTCSYYSASSCSFIYF